MPYSYETQKAELFTDQGQRSFIACRDAVLQLVAKSGAVRALEALTLMAPRGISDNWDQLAVLDRMVEIGDLRELTGPGVAAQYRVFLSGRRD